MAGRNHRKTTKTDSLEHAKEIADDWYLGLKVKQKSGELVGGKTFADAATQFLREYEIITEGQRNPRWVLRLKSIIRVHLLPFFGDKRLAEITPGLAQEYRIHRVQNGFNGRRPARNTLLREITALRQVLKTAQRHQWIDFVPDLSEPFRASTKIAHRAWFSPQEYRLLYQTTRQKAQTPENKRWRWEAEQLHDLVLFMANTGLRPDEVARIQYRDVTIAKDQATGEVILEIEVRGKRGVGHCKSTAGAVVPFRRLRKRNNPQRADRVFPKMHQKYFNSVLGELDLKFDRDGNRRTLYSLRHSYICFRLMEGADI